MTGFSEAADMLHWKCFLVAAVKFNLIFLPDSLGLSWIPSFRGLGRSAWLHVRVASHPQSPFQLGDFDLHSLSCTSLIYVSSAAYETRFFNRLMLLAFLVQSLQYRVQTVPSLECKTVPENFSCFCAIVVDTLVPKFKHII